MWIKLDDQWMEHPKMLRAGRDARDLWLAGLTWSAKYQTDGFIPDGALPVLAVLAGIDVANCQDFARRLLDVCLWEATAGGYMIHDYLKYNPSKDQAAATAEARKEAGRAGGVAKASKMPSKTPSKMLAKDKQNPAPSPSPSLLTMTTSARANCDSYVSAGIQDFSNNITLISSGPQADEVADRLTEIYERRLFDWWALAIKAAQDNNGRNWNYVRTTIDNCLKLGTPPGAPRPQPNGSNRGNGNVKPFGISNPANRATHNPPATDADRAPV